MSLQTYDSCCRSHVTCAGLGFRDLCYTVRFRWLRGGLQKGSTHDCWADRGLGLPSNPWPMWECVVINLCMISDKGWPKSLFA